MSKELVKSFLYSVLLSLHNKPNYNTFLRTYDNKLNNVKKNLILEGLDKEKLKKAITNNLILKYLQNLPTIQSNTLLDIILFLMECDLINVTVCSDKQDDLTYNWLNKKLDIKEITPINFFRDNNITIKYPLFYVNILKELAISLNLDLNILLTPGILGSIVECNIRGLYSYKKISNNKNFLY